MSTIVVSVSGVASVLLVALLGAVWRVGSKLGRLEGSLEQISDRLENLEDSERRRSNVWRGEGRGRR